MKNGMQQKSDTDPPLLLLFMMLTLLLSRFVKSLISMFIFTLH